MDASRFDRIAASLSQRKDRRSVTAALLALTVGISTAEAKKKKKTCPPGTIPHVIKKGKGKKKKSSVVCYEEPKPSAVDCSKKPCGADDGKGGICKNGFCPDGLTCHQVVPLDHWSCFCTDLLFECPPNTCGQVEDKCGTLRPCGNCPDGHMCLAGSTKCCASINRPCVKDSDCCYQDRGNTCSGGVCVEP